MSPGINRHPRHHLADTIHGSVADLSATGTQRNITIAALDPLHARCPGRVR